MDAFRDGSDNLHSPRPDEPASEQSSSATGIFGLASAAPSRNEDDLLAALGKKPDEATAAGEITSPAQTVAPAAAAFPAAQGDFTRMLQALKTTEPASGQAEARPSEELAKVFSPVSMDKVAAAEKMKSATPAAQAGSSGESAPGSFTQMFRSMSTPSAATPPVAPLANAAAQTATPSAPATSSAGSGSGSGEFTRIFSSMHAKSPVEPATAAPPPAPVPSVPAAQGAGEFTKTFQGLQSGAPKEPVREPFVPAVAAEPPRSARPGAFTQMFSSLGPQKTPDLNAEFNSLKPLAPEPQKESAFRFGETPAPASPGLPAQGGFTQLLQALNQEPAKAPEPILPPSLPAAATAPAAGGFTQLLRTLSEQPAPAPQAAPPVFPQPVVPPSAAPSFAPPVSAPVSAPAIPPVLPPIAATPSPVASGPGEFTRVISGSALRDIQGPGAAMVPPAAPPAVNPGWPQMPAAPPPIPRPPMAAPPAASAPHFAPPAFSFQPPAAPPPPAVPAAPGPGAFQKYLPLILVLNVFLMLAIVLILIFVMHHK